MKTSSQNLKINARTGLAPVQAKAVAHFKKHPDKESFPVRVIDAGSFLSIMFTLMVTMRRGTLRDTFEKVTNWNDCVQWKGTRSVDGFVSSSVTKGIWEFFTGAPIPAGGKIMHACHDKNKCTASFMCDHRMCVNPLHLYLTNSSGITSRSQNAKKGDPLKKRKMAAYKLTWTSCKYGHETTPGKECARCNADAQERSRVRTREARALHEAGVAERTEELRLAGVRAYEECDDLFKELNVRHASELALL